MHGCICLVVDGQMGLHLNWDWEGGGGGGGEGRSLKAAIYVCRSQRVSSSILLKIISALSNNC